MYKFQIAVMMFTLVIAQQIYGYAIPPFGRCPSGCSQVRCSFQGCFHCRQDYCHHVLTSRYNGNMYIDCVRECPNNHRCEPILTSSGTKRLCVLPS